MNLKTRFAFAAAALTSAHSFRHRPGPAKPVKIIVPYPPGGSVDVVTRKIAAKLQEQTGQTFFVENKAGATGTIGLAAVVQSPADGYTLAANDTTYALLPHIFKKLPFDPEKDLLPVGACVFAPMSLVVKADSRFKTLGDLIAAAKAQPEKVTYGPGGAGTTPHFVSEALGIAAGVKFMHVPYKGAARRRWGCSRDDHFQVRRPRRDGPGQGRQGAHPGRQRQRPLAAARRADLRRSRVKNFG
jgi:tripartite-type tricarboxylate transporter receptor subunit TctC